MTGLNKITAWEKFTRVIEEAEEYYKKARRDYILSIRATGAGDALLAEKSLDARKRYDARVEEARIDYQWTLGFFGKERG